MAKAALKGAASAAARNRRRRPHQRRCPRPAGCAASRRPAAWSPRRCCAAWRPGCAGLLRTRSWRPPEGPHRGPARRRLNLQGVGLGASSRPSSKAPAALPQQAPQCGVRPRQAPCLSVPSSAALQGCTVITPGTLPGTAGLFQAPSLPHQPAPPLFERPPAPAAMQNGGPRKARVYDRLEGQETLPQAPQRWAQVDAAAAALRPGERLV